MLVIIETCRRLANELKETGMDNSGIEHKFWIDIAPFHTPWYINDGEYLPE